MLNINDNYKIKLNKTSKIKLQGDTMIVIKVTDCLGSLEGKVYSGKYLLSNFSYLGVETEIDDGRQVRDKAGDNRSVDIMYSYLMPLKCGVWNFYDTAGNITKTVSYTECADNPVNK